MVCKEYFMLIVLVIIRCKDEGRTKWNRLEMSIETSQMAF